jgi:LmbE family N-acetylglucosaminyl deacetylase
VDGLPGRERQIRQARRRVRRTAVLPFSPRSGLPHANKHRADEVAVAAFLLGS